MKTPRIPTPVRWIWNHTAAFFALALIVIAYQSRPLSGCRYVNRRDIGRSTDSSSGVVSGAIRHA